MGKLNIAHHKSYHPYRRDNIERVRRDEEEARLKETAEEGRMMLAVCLLLFGLNSSAHTGMIGCGGSDGLVEAASRARLATTERPG